MLQITPSIQLQDDEIQSVFIRSPGPGGQNVNKVSTAVQLRFNLKDSQSIPLEIKQRLAKLAGKRLTTDGMLLIEARQYRSQERNRQAAIDRLVKLIQQASLPPRPRHKTRPTQASIKRRLETKRKRSEIKRSRQNARIED